VWTQLAKLVAADTGNGDNFGYNVAVSGDTAVVGAWLDDDAGNASGSAYVFLRSEGVWTQQAKLVAADAELGDNFGIRVAVSGDTAVVGANFDDDAGSASGSAYVFELSSDECGETGSGTVTATMTATDSCDNESTCMATFTIEDTTAPSISCSTTQTIYSVDGNCEATVSLEGTVTDACCIDAANVSVSASLAMANAMLTFNELTDCTFTQVDANTVDVLCTALVSDLDSCPATVEFTVNAMDCCGNNAAQCSDTAEVQDDINPVIGACPADIVANADAGACDGTNVSWTDPTAADNCDPAPSVSCVPMSGSFFSVGTTPVTCTATDACGNEDTCSFNVTVNPVNDVQLEVELAGVFNDALPLTRCIHFVTDDCGTSADVELTFTDHDTNPATPLRFEGTIELPSGNRMQLCVKDEQHTLYETTTLSVNGAQYDAPPVSLRSGDTDNDSDVDIHDVSYLIFTYGGPEGAAACPFDNVRGADFSNDGNVGAEDYTFITANWLEFSSCSCTFLPPPPNPNPEGLDRMVAIEAELLAPEVAAKADMNADGRVDHKDVRLFEDRYGFDNLLSDKMRMSAGADIESTSQRDDRERSKR
jgi:hypothetical protein